MTKKEHIQYWLSEAREDQLSMKAMLDIARYDWALFVGHLSIEKVLKAAWVNNNSDNFPPKTHNLLKLATEAKLELNKEDQNLLLEITEFNITARYPDYKKQFRKKCTKEFSTNYVKKIEDLFRCIQEMM